MGWKVDRHTKNSGGNYRGAANERGINSGGNYRGAANERGINSGAR